MLCPDNTWTATDNHCYKKVDGVVANEAEAKTKCAALGSGSVPVTVHSDADNTELLTFFASSYDTSFYIGLEYSPAAKDWKWVDSGDTHTYHAWDNTADITGTFPCAYVKVVNTKLTDWLTNDCKQPVQSLVCQSQSKSLDNLYEQVALIKTKLDSVTCPDKTWTPQGNNCYRNIPYAVANEAEAKTKCAAMATGAVPVTIHSATDNRDLNYFHYASPDTSFYIGLEYDKFANEWLWLDSGNTHTYHPWNNTADITGALPCAYVKVV
ncbi:unnamed protein product, partial [Medioppia subpectinata]